MPRSIFRQTHFSRVLVEIEDLSKDSLKTTLVSTLLEKSLSKVAYSVRRPLYTRRHTHYFHKHFNNNTENLRVSKFISIFLTT